MRYFAFKLTTVSAIVFSLGICLGAACICLIPQMMCENLVLPVTEFTKKTDSAGVMIKFAVTAIKPILFMWVMGFTKISAYVNALTLTYRGCVLGVVTGALVRCEGFLKGFYFWICGIMPQNLLYIAILIFMAVLSYKFSCSGVKTKKEAAAFSVCLLIGAAGCLLCGFFDAFLTPILLNRG